MAAASAVENNNISTKDTYKVKLKNNNDEHSIIVPLKTEGRYSLKLGDKKFYDIFNKETNEDKTSSHKKFIDNFLKQRVNLEGNNGKSISLRDNIKQYITRDPRLAFRLMVSDRNIIKKDLEKCNIIEFSLKNKLEINNESNTNESNTNESNTNESNTNNEENDDTNNGIKDYAKIYNNQQKKQQKKQNKEYTKRKKTFKKSSNKLSKKIYKIFHPVKNCIKKKEIIFGYSRLKEHETTGKVKLPKTNHMNSLIIDIKKKYIIVFDPKGSSPNVTYENIPKDFLYSELDQHLTPEDIDIKKFKYITTRPDKLFSLSMLKPTWPQSTVFQDTDQSVYCLYANLLYMINRDIITSEKDILSLFSNKFMNTYKVNLLLVLLYHTLEEDKKEIRDFEKNLNQVKANNNNNNNNQLISQINSTLSKRTGKKNKKSTLKKFKSSNNINTHLQNFRSLIKNNMSKA
jgi:hypothetical protein